MTQLSKKQQQIMDVLSRHGSLSSSHIHSELSKAGENISLVTVKRELSAMTATGLISPTGQGRSRAYSMGTLGRILSGADPALYCAIEPDKRSGLDRFNFDLFPSLPADIFTVAERAALDKATHEYHRRSANVALAIKQKELERLIIELSWKSSKLEGNTYTLLDTEKLILEHQEARGHDKKEARMILNHKDAFTFTREHRKDFRTLTRTNLEALHQVLTKGLGVNFGFRQKPVGVTGSKYRPLDNRYQIQEAVDALAAAIERMATPYAKALVALIGVSYIQPFEDGNKRTARLMANALLLAYDCAPLSYRSIEEKDYREAGLVFYELNAIRPFKQLFMEQYVFAANNYLAA